MTKNILQLIVAVFVLIIAFTLYSLWQNSSWKNNVENNNLDNQKTEIKINKQSDFKMDGLKIFTGYGTEPGFTFVMSQENDKFGIDLTSSYGESKYVGYLDLVNIGTGTQVFFGKLLDINNQEVVSEIKIEEKKCFAPSGDEIMYTVNLKVGEENLTGCGEAISN